MSYFRFEKLDVWQDARLFASFIYKTTSNYPPSEKFAIVGQLRRAAISIVLNIAEGSTRGTDPDFKRFLKIAQGSIHEVVAAMYLSRSRVCYTT